MPLEVADDRVHLEPRVLLRNRMRARNEHVLAHVERNEASQCPLVDERVQQQAGLLRGARAELDKGLCSRLGGDHGRALVEDLPLRAREVVLGQTGDLVEEARAALVVEPDRGDLLWDVFEAAKCRLVERCTAVGLIDEDLHANAHGRRGYASRAQRNPAKI